MDTDLTRTDEKDLELYLAQADLTVAGAENLQPGDIGMPPRLRISQDNRPIMVGDDKVEAGSIVNTLTGEVFPDSVEIVPVMFLPRTRVCWPETFSADNQPLCASDDGEYPAASTDARALLEPHSGLCTACEDARFNDDGTPPRCKLQRNFLVWLVEQKEPAILTFQSTALAAARKLTMLARTQGLQKTICFTTQSVVDNRGNWRVPVFVKGRKLALEELTGLVEVREELRNLVVSADLVQDEPSEDETSTDAPSDVVKGERKIPF